MTELGLDTTALDAIKYDPDQPRVPAGSGRASGQFGPGTGAEAFVAPAAAALRNAATSLLEPSLDPALLSRFALLASHIATPVAILGALLIPTRNSGGVTTGTLPDAGDIRFRRDDPAGTLVLATTLADGTDVKVLTESRRGLYVDLKTGSAIGRNFGEQIYLDLAAVHLVLGTEVQAEHKEVPKAWTTIDKDEPKLCPAPVKDAPHEPKEHVLDYEDDVHRRVNPLLPIPRGYAVKIVDPSTGILQYPDDCFRYAGDLVDGDMRAGDFADAKGEEYERLLSDKRIGSFVMARLMDVSSRHLRAAEARGSRLKIYFAERGAADRVRRIFHFDADLRRVSIGYLPPRRPKQHSKSC